MKSGTTFDESGSLDTGKYGVQWVTGMASEPTRPPVSTSAVKHSLMLLKGNDPGLAVEVDDHIRSTHDVHNDALMTALGSPIATISVFALLGAFLSSMAGKAADDAYQSLKRLLSRATPVNRNDSPQEWAVIHDIEHNCVIECPKDVPAEGAIQLAQMARDGLSMCHLRWDADNRTWQTVGTISGDPPELPPDGEPSPL
ncbi:hypothetical protein ACFY4K_34870 [Streptomyces leeuwenhoekii]|uniref:hypothetical protein n=1 Tax=Streptomyces leeuwenhoekii TaxID=1437453 RepID=UPI003686D96F